MIYISCQFENPIGRSDYSDYLRALTLDVSGCDVGGQRFLTGKLAAHQVLIGDAPSHGMSLFDVCDQDSQGLYEAQSWWITIAANFITAKTIYGK